MRHTVKSYCSIVMGFCLLPPIYSAEKLAEQFSLAGPIPSLEWLPTLLRSKYEIDQLGGIAQLMELTGPDKALPVLAATMNKNKLLQLSEIACLIATSSRRTEHISKMLGHAETKKLGAAALAAMALIEYLLAEKFQQAGTFTMADPEAGNAVADEAKKSTLTADEALQFSRAISELISDKNELLVEYGLIAAAYTADKAHAQSVMALNAKTGGIPGLKLLYAVRCQQPIGAALITEAFAKNTCRAEFFERNTGNLSRCQTLVPSICSAAEAVGLMGEDGISFIKYVHETLVNDKDIRTQVASAIALGRVQSEDSIPYLLAAMEKCEWPVLVHVLDALGRIPSAISMDRLIARFGKETGRFRLDVLYAINAIAGERLVYNTEEELKIWWKQAAPNFVSDKKKTDEFREKHRVIDMGAPGLSGFYGMRIYSDRLAFVLDSSASMRGDRFDNLRQKTTEALLPLIKLNHVRSNVVDFGGMVEVYYPDVLTPDLKGMMAYVNKSMDLSTGTRSMDAIIGSFRIHDVDSIYFLSDGAPVVSIRESWDDIRRYVALMNRYRPVSIFSIGFKAGLGDYKGMAQLSWENGGNSERIE